MFCFKGIIVHELIPFLAPLRGQNIIYAFSNLKVSIFWKSMMGCKHRQLLTKIEVLYRPEWTKGKCNQK